MKENVYEVFVRSGEKINVVQNSDDALRTISYADVVFLSYASMGAMGCPGEILVATSQTHGGKWYCFSMMEYGFENLCLVFPQLSVFRNPEMEKDTLKEWRPEYLGGGNFLLVRNDYHENFCRLLDLLEPRYAADVYVCWQGMARLLLFKGKGRLAAGDAAAMKDADGFNTVDEADIEEMNREQLEVYLAQLEELELDVLCYIDPEAWDDRCCEMRHRIFVAGERLEELKILEKIGL